jgi:hypothetical protein
MRQPVAFSSAIGRKAANRVIGLVVGNQVIEYGPRNLLQKTVENAIRVPHVLIPCSRPERRETPDHE